MIKSMTAYGRASKAAPAFRWVVEIHSINRKMLDINVNLPKELLRFDIELRGWVAEALERGQITIRVAIQEEGAAAQSAGHALKALKASWEKIAKELGYDAKKEIDLRFLVEQMQLQPPVGSTQDDKAVSNTLKSAFQEALGQLMRMKEKEGKALAQDIGGRLKLIEKALAKIAKSSAGASAFYRKKLMERIQELGPPGAQGDERILREVALFAEKVDVTEEQIRLRSHLEQFYKLLAGKEKSVGRTLDFLIQEMNREVNTISSKAADSEIAHLVVTVKSELEKIREQVQNIE